jgi:hypothetical protein
MPEGFRPVLAPVAADPEFADSAAKPSQPKGDRP